MSKHRFKWVFLFILIGVPLLFIQCNQNSAFCEECEGDSVSFEQQKLPGILSNVQLAGIDLPDGTEAKYLNPREVEFTFPDGYFLVAKNDENYQLMSGPKRYQCTCTGTGCNVILFPGGDGEEDQIGCSSCTSACTGKWITQEKAIAKVTEYVGIVYVDLGISFIESSSKTISCGADIDANLFFKVSDLKSKLDDFFKENELEIWDGISENYVSLPIQAFGKSFILRFNNNQSAGLNKALATSSMLPPPTCNCDSGGEGCDYEAITHKPCGICPPITVGHQCNSGECVSCSMIIPE